MGLISRTLPALSNGVSRQPAILRSPDQNADELNTWSEIAVGVSRRPPTVSVKKLSGLTVGNAQVHHINRDVNERYIVIVDNGSLRVFDAADGTEKTVSFPVGSGYLDAEGPDYRLVTIADYTFIVNTTKTVALKAAGDDQVAQDSNNVWLGGSNPDLDDPDLATQILPGSLFQHRPNPTPSGGIAGRVASFDKLPDITTVANGAVYEVLGGSDTAFVSYYVMKDGDVWDETVRPGLPNAIDETTMPHALVRQGDGTFHFAPFSWAPRRVGDAETNPLPLFVGRTINDVFFFQNRLGFLADESAIFSGAGDYGDFWRKTVLDYLDADSLAVSATTLDVAILDYAVPFNGGVVLFSKQHQFVLTSGDAGLGAASVAINPITTFLMADGVKPVYMGDQVHFASDANGSVSILEYASIADTDPSDAAELTAHVPRLLPEGASQIIPASDADAMFVLARNAADATNKARIWVYQYFWDGSKKLLSAWRIWDFDDGLPVSGAFVSGSLYLVMERDDGTYLETINLSPEATSENQDHLIYLDRGCSPTGTYDAVTDTTSFTLPYVPADQSTVRLVRSRTAGAAESIINPASYVWTAADTVEVTGDESASAVTAGQLYTTRLEFSEQFATDWQGRPVASGRLQLRTWRVVYADTAFFRAKVQPYGQAAVDAGSADEIVYDFTGKPLGSLSLAIGQPSYVSGDFLFSVAGNSKDARVLLENDTPFASKWVSAEFEALYWRRS